LFFDLLPSVSDSRTIPGGNVKRRVWVLSTLLIFSMNSGRAADSALRNLVGHLLVGAGYIESPEMKELGRAGDAVAVEALRIIDPLRAPSEAVASRLVDLIDLAFENSDMIQIPDDRMPGVSLFFLQTIAKGAYSASLKKRAVRTADILIAIRRKAVAAASAQ
jgi:hypothetical protein